MMTNREERLKALYPEDILSIAKDLTDGELELLQQLNALLEDKYRKDINRHWVDATVPEDFFQDIGNLNYFTNPLLYKDRDGAQTPSQLFQFFMAYTLARFDVSLATLLGVHQGLGHNTFLFGGSK
ncbi:glutaryl-CoA dehydrogenase, partial [Staphylococcus agnetis]|nr:glutaryl-CoA dehydrogenase [Staphylococcus agnetis]